MGLQKAIIESDSNVGIVESNHQVDLRCIFSQHHMVENSPRIIFANELDLIAGLIGEFLNHLITQSIDVVGQDTQRIA